jgi:trehalose synthase-fused probable maltokinase
MESKARPSRRRAPRAELVERAARDLLALLPQVRWFGGKGRTIADVVAIDEAWVPGTAGALALFRVEYTAGDPERYAFPVIEREGQPADALDDAAFCGALVEHMRRGGPLPGRLGVFQFAATDILPALLPTPSRAAVRITSEQSNTSIVIARKAILKVYRRLESGPNPEIELTDVLTRQAAFRGAPRLAGTIVYEAPGQEPTAVATLQEFVPNHGDAWTAVQGHLDEYYATILRSAAGAPDAFAQALAAADAKQARSLGVLTGQLHAALAAATGNPALEPEPITVADLHAWAEGGLARLDRTMAALAAALDALPLRVRATAQRVLDRVGWLREGLAPLPWPGTAPMTKIRIHGDYHLGQVLSTENGFTIVDFEGEPARSLAERRAKQCALKDVAGMLRSYAYAARAAALRVVEAHPGDRTLDERLAPWVGFWGGGARTAFLEGYLAETAERGASFLPRDRETLDALLRRFELDKAVYELGYELNNRPAWVQVPLAELDRAISSPPRAEIVEIHPEEGPFRFVECVELREFVGVRAEDERQLAELIDQVAVDSIYYHTHAFFLRHKFVAGIYPNDFATWVAVNVRDHGLGERLAMLDPVDFPDLEALRREFVSVIDDHLRRLQIVPRVVSAEPFDFVRSRIVQIPMGVEVKTLEELRQALLQVDASAVYFHLVEARARLGRGDNDFARWLERGLGLPRLAERVRALNPYSGSLERTRARLLQLLDDALGEGVGR